MLIQLPAVSGERGERRGDLGWGRVRGQEGVGGDHNGERTCPDCGTAGLEVTANANANANKPPPPLVSQRPLCESEF